MIDIIVGRRHQPSRIPLRIEGRKRLKQSLAVVVPHAEVDDGVAHAVRVVDVQAERSSHRSRVIRQLRGTRCRTVRHVVREIEIVIAGDGVGAMADVLNAGLPFVRTAENVPREMRHLRL